MTATIVNSKYDRGVAALVTPPPYGYLLLGATIAPPKGPPITRPSAARRSVLREVARHVTRIGALDPVARATGYRAVLIAPARPPAFRPSLEPPRFDVTVLIETDSPGALPEAAGAPEVVALRGLLRGAASRVKEMHARCVKAIADVDKPPTGTYLFNYWAAADRATALEVFDHLATWFQAHTGLTNSTVLQGGEDDEFAFVNHARWDAGLFAISAQQFLRPSFHRYVRPTLSANHIQVYPALYRRL